MPEPRRLRRLLAVALLLAVLAAALIWNPAADEQDVLQSRASWAPTPLSPQAMLSQTFVPSHDGLSGVEVLVARYRPAEPLPDDYALCLRIERVDDTDSPLVESCRSISQLEHNASFSFAFGELRQVAGVPLRVAFWANQPADVTLWATAEESYADGALSESGNLTAGDLRLTLHYRYHLTDALAELGQMAGEWAWPLLCLALLLIAPGMLLSLTLCKRAFTGYLLPLGLVTWPLALLWASTVGVPYGATMLWLLCAVGLLGTLLWLVKSRPARLRLLAGWRDPAPWLLLVIVAVSLAARLLNVRNLVVPNWVDALHHAEITQLIVDQAGLPDDGGRFVALPGFYYHFGLHALAAALAQMTRIPTYRAVLIVGQTLIALAPVAVYTLTRSLSRSRPAALIAALMASAWSYMPAYYASWARYTQMAGLLILPGAMLAILRLIRPGSRRWRDRLLAGVLVAGLLLTHYRVSALLLPWVLIVLARLLWRRDWRSVGGAALAAGAGLMLAGPWLVRLLGPFAAQFSTYYGSLAAAPGAEDGWQPGLLTYRWTPYLLGAGAAGLLWSVVRRNWAVALLGLWTGLCLLLSNLGWLGLPDIWLVNNVSLVISYWLPVGVLGGYLLADLAGLLYAHLTAALRSRVASIWRAGAPALLIGLALWGNWLHVDVVNASTTIAQQEDLQAAAWIARELPDDALILINTTHWSNTARRGADGGWWLPVLADRQVTMPCLLYIQGGHDNYDAINALALAVEEADDLCASGLLERLHQAGITHVYVGAKGGAISPARVAGCAAYVELYAQGPVRVYALSSGERSSR